MQGDPSSLPGVFAALGAGIVSFLSPCVLPLVPGYLSAVTGVSVAELIRQTMTDRLRRNGRRTRTDPFEAITGLVNSEEVDLASKIDEVRYG